MSNTSEEHQKLLNSLDTSLDCNFYNDKDNSCFDLKIFLESKFIKYALGIFTLGVYPIYEWTKRNQYKITQELNNCINKIQELNDKESNRNHKFFNNLLAYININSNSATTKLENKNNGFYVTYILINLAAITCTGGFFLIFLIYKHITTIKIHNSLNAIISEYKKESDELKQKIIKERIAKEQEIANNLNESLKEIHGFNYDNCIQETLNSNQEAFEPIQKDPFILFLVFSSYALLTIFTLGGFMFYVEYQKRVNKVNYRFFDHILKKEVIDKHDFNVRLNDLSNNYDINFDYAAILSQKTNVNSNIFDYTSLFRSIFFRNKLNKFLSLCFLIMITFGIYPVYIFYKVAFYNTEYFLLEVHEHKLEAIDIRDNEYFWNKLKVKFKCIYDFYFDAKMAVNISATKLLRSTAADKIKPTKSDVCYLFIQTITSPIFKWAFTLILLLVNYALGLLWLFVVGMAVANPIFICFVIFSVLFVISLGYHLFLLF